jgi:hypothetical protein
VEHHPQADIDTNTRLMMFDKLWNHQRACLMYYDN